MPDRVNPMRYPVVVVGGLGAPRLAARLYGRSFAHRGFERVVTTFGDEPMEKLGCGECVECVSVCPTGAFIYKEGKKKPE